MSDLTTPSIPGPIVEPLAPTPPASPPAPPAPAAQAVGTWQPVKAVARTGRYEAIEFVVGNGANNGFLMVEFRLVTPRPGVAGFANHDLVENPIRESLRDRLRTSELRARHRALRDQHAAAVRRQVIAQANVAKIQADRRLTEAKAAPGMAARLVQLTKTAKAAQEELDAAAAEVGELTPLLEAARIAVVAELRALLPELSLRERQRLKAELDVQREKVLDLIAGVASADLTRLAALDATFGRFFGMNGKDLTPLVEAMIGEADAAPKPAEPKEDAPPKPAPTAGPSDAGPAAPEQSVEAPEAALVGV